MSKRKSALVAAAYTFFFMGAAHAAVECIAPPVLVTPLSYVDKCPGDSGFPKDVRAGGKDVYIKLPTTRTCSASLTVTGAKNVRITGGHFVQGDTALATITIRNLSTASTEPKGTIFIDGLNIDVNGRTADAIRTYNHKGNLILQNANVRGSIGEVIHAQNGGPLASLTMQNVTAITGYQGLFTPYRLSTGHGTRKLTLDRVQFAYDPKYSKSPLRLLYMGSADNSTDRVPDLGSTFSSVYLDGLFWKQAFYKASYAEPAASTTCSTYATKHKITGSVCQGPPASEFAPAAQVGLTYSRSFFCSPPVPPDVCAAGTTPPPQAAAAGLTNLAFCDNFSADTVARGTTAQERDITGTKKWTTERAALFGTIPPTAAENFVFNADGTLTVTPSQQQFQWFMSSTVLRDSVLKGFWIAKKPKFYAEIRWKFKKGTSTAQQPAFWSMDACHLYGKPALCSAKNNNRFIEPDFWEYYFAAWGTHYYEASAPVRNLARCTDQNGNIRVNEDQWFTAGTLVTDVPEMKYYKDEQLLFTRTTSSRCSEQNASGVTTASFISELKDGDYPILIGSRDNEIITIDYVRVWLAP
jgi:hypothetical protein